MVGNSDPVNDTTPHNQGEMSESEIDETLEDTFPASDPPSWTLGTNHREEPTIEDKSDEDDDSGQR